MFDEQAILNELTFKAVRSSGAGGQHVNKTASKVELTFDLESSIGSEGANNTSPVEYAYPATKTSVPFGVGQKSRGVISCATHSEIQRLQIMHRVQTCKYFDLQIMSV